MKKNYCILLLIPLLLTVLVLTTRAMVFLSFIALVLHSLCDYSYFIFNITCFLVKLRFCLLVSVLKCKLPCLV